MSDDQMPLQVFGAFAAAFEETFKDDDWKRLEPFLAEDAVYSVVNLGPVSCSLRGCDAILAGIRKSVDGFDRRFATRALEIRGTPQVTGTNVRVDWRVTYTSDDTPDVVISAFSVARVADGKIVELSDVYDPGVAESFEDWQQSTGMSVDAAYV